MLLSVLHVSTGRYYVRTTMNCLQGAETYRIVAPPPAPLDRRLDNRSLLVINTKVNPISPNRDPKYIHLPEERKSVRKTTKTLVTSNCGPPPHPRTPSAVGSAEALSTPMVASHKEPEGLTIVDNYIRLLS
jgi:hypothetical protein